LNNKDQELIEKLKYQKIKISKKYQEICAIQEIERKRKGQGIRKSYM